MICSKCGAQIPDDAKFCSGCGNNVAAENANPIPQPTNNETNNTPFGETAASEEPTPVQPEAAPVQPEAAPQQQDTPNYNTYNPTPQPIPQTNSSNDGFSQESNYGNTTPDSDGNASKNGLLILGVIALAALVVIILLFNLIFGGNSWKDVIKDQIKYLNKQDDDIEDYYLTTYGEICGEFNYEQDKLIAKLTDNDEWEDDAFDEIDSNYDYFDDLYGDDWEIDYEIKSKKALSESKLDDIADDWEIAIEELEDTLDILEDIEDPEDYNDEFDEDDLEKLIKFYEKWIKKLEDKDVKKGYKVKYKLTIEGDDDDTSDTTTSNIVKIGGDWVEDSFYFTYPSVLY